MNDLVTQKPPQPPQLILGEETTLWGILPFLDFKVKPELSMNKHFVYTQQQSLTSMCSEPFAVPFPARSLSPSLTWTKVSFASPHSTLEISSIHSTGQGNHLHLLKALWRKDRDGHRSAGRRRHNGAKSLYY